MQTDVIGPVLVVAIGVVLVVVVSVVVMYNRFISQGVLVNESWSQVDVELQRRHDLIPNLVATVKGYAAHEAAVLGRVTSARTAAQQHAGDSPQHRRAYEEEVTGSVHQLVAVAEGYPELRSNENFVHLQKELRNTEDRIAAGRRFYNGNVRDLNTRVRSFPSNLVASVFGFTPKEFFELADPTAAAPPGLAH